MSIINKKNEQCFVDGSIQGSIVLGQLYLLKEFSPAKKSQAVKNSATYISVLVSEFLMTWLKQQSFYPNV